MKLFSLPLHSKLSEESLKYRKLFNLQEWKSPDPNLDDLNYLEKVSAAEKFLFFKGNNKAKSIMKAGYTYLGQFIAHDMSYDPSSPTGNDSTQHNLRTPALDLDSIYGGGPEKSPHLYDEKEGFVFKLIKQVSNDHPKFITQFYDFPSSGRTPVLADPRNDEHIILAQLQIAFMMLHNHFIRLLKSSFSGIDLFNEARKRTTWHYQYVVVNDYLNQILGHKRLDPIEPLDFIPLEFAAAAFRFGHSQVRSVYKLHAWFPNAKGILPDPRYGGLITCVDWRLFFGDGIVVTKEDMIKYSTEPPPHDNKHIPPIPNLIISPILVKSLWMLDFWGETINLVRMDLLRGLKYKLASGQEIARHIKVEVIPEAKWLELDQLFKRFSQDLEVTAFQKNTPLFYYILAEAALMKEGKCLGAVGSYIVETTIIGILKSDPNAYLHQNPAWKPNEDVCDSSGKFTMKELLKMAGAEQGVLVPPS